MQIAARDWGWALAPCLATLFAGPAAAQAINSKYWLEVSAYRPSVDTMVNVSRPGFPGTDIDLESDLNLNKHETLPAVYVGARLGSSRRWMITGEYYALERNGTRTATRDINFDGATYLSGATLESELHTDVYRVAVGYALLRNDKAELGAVIGLHATDVNLGVDGQARVGNATASTERRHKKFMAPLPTVGVFGTYEVADRVVLTGRADYMSLSLGDYDGSILNLQAGISYRVYKAVEIGAAYRYVSYDLTVEKDRYTADMDYDFNGPAVFLRIGFR